MLTIGVFVGVAIFWAVVYFFDIFLRSCQNYPYIWLLNRLGTSVHFGYARWYTTVLNRLFQRVGSWKPKLLQRWFSLGAFCALILFVPAILLLVVTASKYFTSNNSPTDQVLAPALPGVNLPFNEIVYYLLTLLLCSVIHEIGHATAAVREDVRVLGAGLLLLGVVPAAFVDLPTEHLRQLNPWQQLRIYCAGVWHNIALSVVAALILVTLPFTTLVAYQTGAAVLVTAIQADSPASGRAGLSIGDQILSINDCLVTDHDRWYKCLALATVPLGYCTDIHFVDSFIDSGKPFPKDVDIVDCCPANSPQSLCFRQTDPSNQHTYVCMPARQVLSQAPSTCNLTNDCPSSRYTCLFPSTDSSTKLLQIRRQEKDDVLFLGHPGDLFYSVTVSNYIPKWSFVPAKLPAMVETLCRYLISFSGALAVLNVVPCVALDGQWITLAAIDLLLADLIPSVHKRNGIYVFLMIIGSLLLAINIVLGLFSLL